MSKIEDIIIMIDLAYNRYINAISDDFELVLIKKIDSYKNTDTNEVNKDLLHARLQLSNHRLFKYNYVLFKEICNQVRQCSKCYVNFASMIDPFLMIIISADELIKCANAIK